MATKPASFAKITRPISRGLIPRERLFRLLDAGRDCPIIWISGPPGSGKTSLVSSYIDARKILCLWYQIDERDADVAEFFYYMGIAAKEAAPRKRKPLPPFSPDYLRGISAFTRRYFEDLYSRLNPSFSKGGRGGSSRKEGTERFVIVLDNYQNVPVGSGFHDMIINGLDVIPNGIQVMVFSRDEPPAPFARLRANDRIRFLGWNDLRLTPEESREIFLRKSQKNLSDETLLSLHQKADGWAAGLMLLLQDAALKKGESEPIGALPELPHEAVFDYLGNEIFSRTDEDTQTFWLKTAFLPRISVPMAEKLTGIHGSEQILSRLRRCTFLAERVLPAGSTYHYHPLLRAFLLSHAKNFFSIEEIHKVQQTAARILEEASLIEEASELFIEAGDWAGLGGLIQRNAQSLLFQGRIKTLEDWLLRIPQDVMENSPWLQYWLGTCRAPVSTIEGRRHFETAFSRFRMDEDSAGAFLAWAGVVDSYVYEWSDFTPLDRWIELVEELLDRHGGFPSVEIEARVAGSMFSALVYRCPQHPRLVFWKERLNDLLLRTNDISQRLMMGTNLVHYHLWVGDFAKAHSLIELLRPASHAQAIGPLVMLTWRFVESFYLQITGNFDGAHKGVMKGLETAEVLGVHLLDFLLLSSGVYNALSACDLAAAGDFLSRMKSALNPAHWADVGHYHYLAGWEALLRNDLPHASEHARSALRLWTITGIPFAQALAHIAMAEVLISSKRFQEANSHIAEVLSIGKGMNSLFLDFVGHFAEARLAMGQGDEPHCLAALRGAMELGKRQGFVNHHWGSPSGMARLCAKALEAGIEVDYVQDLIRKRNLFLDVAPSDIENWPWPLKIYTLGRFEVKKDGKPISSSGKVQRIPLLMLKALIALGGKDVKEEEVSDLLWPEADGDLAHDSFRQNLSRLRRLLGSEKAVRFQDRKITLDPRHCWIDVWAFERIHGHAESLSKDSPPQEVESEVFRLSEKAMNLYKGHFLLGEAEHYWLLPLRGRLKRKFLNLVSRLADHYSKRGQWRKAADCYERGLEADNLAEELYQRLMVCYANLGLRGEAISVYKRCKEALFAAEGAEPSMKTHAIYVKIKQNS